MRFHHAAAAVGCLCIFALDAVAAPCSGFTDVSDADSTYCSAVTFIKNKGVTLGCTVTAYCPDAFVTRLQMALFMTRMARGGPNNVLDDATSGIGSGNQNITHVAYSWIGGGASNQANGAYSTIGGGQNNVTTAYANVVGGGGFNTASSPGGSATVGGGYFNTASEDSSVVAGGYNGVASGPYSAVLGGATNTASGGYSMAVGGWGNVAQGSGSFAAGAQAIAKGANAFVWADAALGVFDPALAINGWGSVAGADNTFSVRSTGGAWFVSGVDGSGNPNAGVKLAAGSGTWSSTSDRASKRDFKPVDTQAVLDKVAALPIETWSYIAEAGGVRHIGPVAQDFHAAFAVGPDAVSITSIDEGGVALAAIKGLNDRLASREAALRASLESQNASLRAELAVAQGEGAQLRARLDRLEAALGY